MAEKAEYYERKGDFKMANIVYDEIINDYPYTVAAYINKGVNLTQMGEHHQAIAVNRKGEELFPENVMLKNNLANLYYDLNKLDSAVFYISKALPYATECDTLPLKFVSVDDIDENKVSKRELHYFRSVIYYELEDYDKCIQDLEKCIDCNYYRAHCCYTIGRCLENLGQFEKGCRYYRQAFELGYDDAKDEYNYCEECVPDTTDAPPLADIERRRIIPILKNYKNEQ